MLSISFSPSINTAKKGKLAQREPRIYEPWSPLLVNTKPYTSISQPEQLKHFRGETWHDKRLGQAVKIAGVRRCAMQRNIQSFCSVRTRCEEYNTK